MELSGPRYSTMFKYTDRAQEKQITCNGEKRFGPQKGVKKDCCNILITDTIMQQSSSTVGIFESNKSKRNGLLRWIYLTGCDFNYKYTVYYRLYFTDPAAES